METGANKMEAEMSAQGVAERAVARPTECPACGHPLVVARLQCRQCGTEIAGEFTAHPLETLSAEERQFVVRFVLAGGSLKGLAEHYGTSYPTIRARLDRLIARLERALSAREAGPDAFLEKLASLVEEGQVTLAAAQALKKIHQSRERTEQ